MRGLAEGLGINPDEVTSPTFTLVHEYRGGRLPLIHVDLYRLDRADLDEIGLDQDLAATGVVAVEWAERMSRPIPGAIDRSSDHAIVGGDQPRRSRSLRPQRDNRIDVAARRAGASAGDQSQHQE